MVGIGQSRRSPEGASENSERWRHQKHWQTPSEIEIILSGSPGRIVTGNPASYDRRVREITVRHSGTNNTVVSLRYDVTVKLSFDVAAQTTRVWSSQDGRKLAVGTSLSFESSDVTGGTTFISAAGLEAEK